jgi:nucleoside 2-deoxyribosyltransferase
MNGPVVYVYLGGPIAGLSYAEAVARREEIAAPLRAAKGVRIVPLSPMRGKKYLAHAKSLPTGGHRKPDSTDEALVARDFNDIQRSDIFVADMLGAKDKSIGTSAECGMCLVWRKFVILIMEKDANVHDHAFVRVAASVRVQTRAEAVDIILDYAGAEED